MMSFLSQYISNVKEDPLIFPIASLCMAIQMIGTLMIMWLPFQGPWKLTASYSAHQILVIGLMVYQTYWGFIYWNATTHEQLGPPANLVTEETDTEGGKFLSQIVLGSLLATIPLQFVVLKEHVDILMHIHHAAMLLMASISLGILSPDKIPIAARYAPFFFGVIELSSIPLVFVDIFHPHKHPEWNAFAKQHTFLTQLNEISRILFAVLYISLRMIYFPKVVFQQVLPDCWNKLQYPENDAYRPYLWTTLVSSLCFTFLQMYWGSLISKQIMKMLGGKRKEEESTDDTKAKIKRV